MKGSRSVVIKNAKTQFDFTVNRNITLVRGDSGSGKTTLYSMVSDYASHGADSGVQIKADCPCVALTQDEQLWKYQLSTFKESIVFVDEGARYITSHDFAASVQATDNYYVIFSRESLCELPYSVDEIYEIKTSRKFHTFQRRFQVQAGHIYEVIPRKKLSEIKTVLTEDSRSGYEFFRHYFENSHIDCQTANNNSGVYGFLQAHRDGHIIVIADGAAFGSQMERVMLLQKQYPDHITVCLPESFEWLILQSGVAPIAGAAAVLANPADYIESSDFFSWERFFTYYLTENSKDTYYAYSKGKLNAFYLNETNMTRIIGEIAARIPKK